MNFQCDDHTIDDLGLFAKGQHAPSIFGLFNHAKTMGGRQRIRKMMETPSNDLRYLKRRRDSIAFFRTVGISLDISNQQMDFIQHYLKSDYLILKNNIIDITAQRIKNRIAISERYYVISKGIQYFLFSIKSLQNFADKILSHESSPTYLTELTNRIVAFCQSEVGKKLMQGGNMQRREIETSFSIKHVFQFDRLIREKSIDETREIIGIIYEIDALVSVASAANAHNLTPPDYIDAEHVELELIKVYHPHVKHPIKNNFFIREKNICFLTGSNMAGKSTLLKAISISIYLAHIGFPVPADSMKCTILNAMMTTINLSDNINLGHSHFMHEVKRIKEAANLLTSGSKYFIVFDELFRGTNVKDAYEASTSIINALARIRQSGIIISTHLIEIAGEINSANIDFKFMKAHLENLEPTYTYKLQTGVSSERLGMAIIKRERIIEILDGADS